MAQIYNSSPAVRPFDIECLRAVLSSEYRMGLELLPATIDLRIGDSTAGIALTKAVALIREANPTAVWGPPPL